MRRRTGLVGAAAALALTAAAGAIALSSSTPQPARAARRSPLSTAAVRRETLSATVSQAGTLTYGAQADGSPQVINQLKGAYTKLPALGRVVRQGQVLYRVDEAPVVLLYGSTPAYRTLSAGMTGRDVAELNRDLVSLGDATSAQLGPRSTTFGPATTGGVERLQAKAGLTRTGKLAFGQAVFEPSALRVTAVSALLGASAEAGQVVVRGTSTRRQVQVALDATQQTDMAVGDRVSITLPDHTTTAGVVTSVGTVATCASSSDSGGSNSSSAATGTEDCSSGDPSSSTPTINVDVAPVNPASTRTWDQAPVQVGITTSRVPSALVVPVTALLARSSGRYAVEVVGDGGGNHLVAVSLGLFDDADGLVQVTGSRLAAGERVVVPSS